MCFKFIYYIIFSRLFNGKKRFIKVSMKKSEQLLKESQKKEDRKENEEQEVEELPSTSLISFHCF